MYKIYVAFDGKQSIDEEAIWEHEKNLIAPYIGKTIREFSAETGISHLYLTNTNLAYYVSSIIRPAIVNSEWHHISLPNGKKMWHGQWVEYLIIQRISGIIHNLDEASNTYIPQAMLGVSYEVERKWSKPFAQEVAFLYNNKDITLQQARKAISEKYNII